ncbi:MAG: glutamate racemase [Acidobacteria bacterium]|nr:glutamate racemase [Acidobacteriota bacterium]
MNIGIFDSGLGGLTIFESIQRRLSSYDYIYLGDSARTPYGSRSFEAIYKFTAEAVRYLFSRDCQLIVIACNTASAKALRSIQQKILPSEYPGRRVLGVIRPSVEAIGRITRSGIVALWATEGTVKSMSFVLELEKLAPEIRLIQQACPLLVPLVEAGELSGPGAEYFVREYWRQTEAQLHGVDTLLLACTHYPLLLPVIRVVVPPHVRILIQGEIVAPSLEDYLRRHPEMETRLARGGTVRFLTTDQSEGFDRLAKIFLGYRVVSEKVDL